MKKEIHFLKSKCIISVIVFAFMATSSCLNRHFIEGRSELISTSDTLLNDSSLFTGRIVSIDMESLYTPAEVWIENTNYKTTSDASGYYALKVLPGIYTIRSQPRFNTWPQLIEEKRDIKIAKNQKIHIDFYMGYTVE